MKTTISLLSNVNGTLTDDHREVTSLLNKQLHSIFTIENSSYIPQAQNVLSGTDNQKVDIKTFKAMTYCLEYEMVTGQMALVASLPDK